MIRSEFPIIYTVQSEGKSPFDPRKELTKGQLDTIKRTKPKEISKQINFPMPVVLRNTASDSFNHVDRKDDQNPSFTMVNDWENPTVSKCHIDAGAGWFYVAEGVKIFIFIDTKRTDLKAIPAAPYEGVWDGDALSEMSPCKVLIGVLRPGDLMFLPPHTKHIAITVETPSFSYGKFISHLYSTIFDIAFYCDVFNYDSRLFSFVKPGHLGELIRTTSDAIDSLPKGKGFNKETFKEIYISVRGSLKVDSRESRQLNRDLEALKTSADRVLNINEY